MKKVDFVDSLIDVLSTLDIVKEDLNCAISLYRSGKKSRSILAALSARQSLLLCETNLFNFINFDELC